MHTHFQMRISGSSYASAEHSFILSYCVGVYGSEIVIFVAASASLTIKNMLFHGTRYVSLPKISRSTGEHTSVSHAPGCSAAPLLMHLH